MSAATSPSADPVMERLEDQIGWYDRKSSRHQRAYKRIKIAEIVAAAVIPFVASLNFRHAALVTGAMGVLVTVFEGLLHLNQHQQQWISYRATCEALRHEKFYFLSLAGPYRKAVDPRALLVERVEALVSQESSKWSSLQLQNNRPEH